MRYGSVCSGIEAASAAWHPLGWKAAWFSEIEPFPCSVLMHHYPDVPNLGDMTKWEAWPDEPIDILVGGTPCQSFSVAGKRGGMDDHRGQLAFAFSAIARRYRPRWIVWENVPGVLSSGRGKDFGSFLWSLAELGYGCAYRVLDAQHFGVAQRRRRVFVVGHLGDWRRAAAVLFERESLCRNPAKGGKAREGVAGGVAPSLTASNDPSRSPQSSEVTRQVAAVVATLTARMAKGRGTDGQDERSGYPHLICMAHGQGGAEIAHGRSPTLTCNHEAPILASAIASVAIPLKDPIDLCSLSPTRKQPAGWGQPGDPAFTMRSGIVPGVALAFAQNQLGEVRSGDVFNTINTNSNASGTNTPMVAFHATRRDGGRILGDMSPTVEAQWGTGGGNVPAVAIGTDCYNGDLTGDVAATISTHGSSTSSSGPTVMQAMQVRRLTPIECERLQGFPDNYTNVPHRGKPAADGPRYKALGNSMAVPCMAWIGQRIQMVDQI